MPPGEWIGVEAVLEVAVPPEVPALYFWALQVSFAERGRAVGGAHLGLQWYPPHPGSTAVNWGGYASDGRELDGSQSALSSATSNVNTRDFAWRPRAAYRLVVTRDDERTHGDLHAWRGEVVDLATGTSTVVRHLFARGSSIGSPMVWSEVFADCDAPGTLVRWRDLVVRSAGGERVAVDSVHVNYQSIADGGCVTTDSSVDGQVFVQQTGRTRRTRQGDQLSLGEPRQQSRS